MNKEIKEGQKYKTRSEMNFHSGTNLIIKKVEGQSSDDFVYFEAENPKKDNRIKGHKRYNKGKARVWWFREYCEVVK